MQSQQHAVTAAVRNKCKNRKPSEPICDQHSLPPARPVKPADNGTGLAPVQSPTYLLGEQVEVAGLHGLSYTLATTLSPGPTPDSLEVQYDEVGEFLLVLLSHLKCVFWGKLLYKL